MTSDAGRPENATVAELGDQARAALSALARLPDVEAFHELLRLGQFGAECLGESARTLAAHSSWSQVAEVAGTSKQAAWSRWRG
jgi:hypothetical protein